MPRPVCGRCQRNMANVHMGATVGFFALATGTARPYEVYQADVYQCGHCGQATVTNYGDRPTWLHFHKGPPPKLDYEVPEK